MVKLPLLLTVVAASRLCGAELPAKWSGTMELDGSRVHISLTLNRSGASITGAVETLGERGAVPVESPRIEGDGVTFQIHDKQNRLVQFRLTAKDGSLSVRP